jgi:glycosyltransferase involved in cell wall biosynthesis
MPKVSIVVPVFNGSKYIEKNAQYILEQDHKDIEVIFVVDSRSTDGSLQKIKMLLPKYQDAVVLEQTEGGLGQARNIGMEHATGDLILFLDVDDHPLPRYLSTLVDTQQKYGADVVMCNYIRSGDADPVIGRGKSGIRVMDRYEAMAARGKNRIPVTSWSMVIRAGIITDNDLRFIPDGYAEDIDFTYRLLSVSDTVCFCEEPLYVYVQNRESICGSSNNERGMAEIRVYNELIDHMRGKEPEFFDTFRRSAFFTMVRSSTRMDAEHYNDFVNDERTKSLMDEELSYIVDPELVFFKMFPRMYRVVAITYMRLVFYREGKTF